MRKLMYCAMMMLMAVPSASADGVTDVPTSPRDFAVTLSPGLDAVQLTWTPPLFEGSAPLLGYKVYRDGDLVATIVEVSYEEALVDVQAVYLVTAYNVHGEGLPSKPGSIFLSTACVTSNFSQVPPWLAVDAGCTFVFTNVACAAATTDPPRPTVCLLRDYYKSTVENLTSLLPPLPPQPVDLSGTIVAEVQHAAYAVRPI